MIVGGGLYENSTSNVTVLNAEQKTTCQLPQYPDNFGEAAGGLVTTSSGSMPLICGGCNVGTEHWGSTNKCYLLEPQGWKEIHSLSRTNKLMAAVSVNQEWVMFNGGTDGWPHRRESILIRSTGANVTLEPLSAARWGPCSAILLNNETTTVVGIMGGAHSGQLKSMERYSCTKEETPNCTKLPNGPDMNKGRRHFGCGSIQTSDVS